MSGKPVIIMFITWLNQKTWRYIMSWIPISIVVYLAGAETKKFQISTNCEAHLSSSGKNLELHTMQHTLYTQSKH